MTTPVEPGHAAPAATGPTTRTTPASSTWSAAVAAGYDHDRPSLWQGDRWWSGRELLARAAGAADWLDGLGLAPGAWVPALVAGSPEAIALTVGGAGSNHPLAPLGVRMTAQELAAVVAPVASPVLLTQPEHEPLARAVAARRGCRVVVIPSLPASGRALAAAPDDVAVVLHTSGTTGLPKAVPMPQWRLAARARVYAGVCGLGPESCCAAVAPFHHVAGLGNVAVALAAGARITGLPRFSVGGWGLLRELGVTHTNVVPAMLEMLLAAGQAHLPGLRSLVYGGAPIRPGTLRRVCVALPGVRLYNFFGQTEGSPITVLGPGDHADALRDQPDLLLSVGRAVPGVELAVRSVAADGVGEVWARADHFFRRDGAGWLDTGDLGRTDADGRLYLAGRRNDMIIRGGENVHPLEVEIAVGEHPRVADVAVAGAADERLGETVVAFVVASDPADPPSAAELHAFTRARLSGFKVPVRWHLVAELPRSPNGKVLRRSLREPGAR